MSVKYTKKIALDVGALESGKSVNAKQSDSGSRFIKAIITRHGKQFVLDAENMQVKFRGTMPDGTMFLNDCNINEDGTATIELTDNMLANTGCFDCDIVIIGDEGETLSTANFTVNIVGIPYESGGGGGGGGTTPIITSIGKGLKLNDGELYVDADYVATEDDLVDEAGVIEDVENILGENN